MRAAACACALLAPVESPAQTPVPIEVARARYEAARNGGRALALDGRIAAQLADIDARLDAAARLGRTGEMRRLLAHANTLLAGREWTPLDDYNQSLVLRTEQLFIDATRPYRVRLEQIYEPVLELTDAPAVRASVRPLLSQPAGVPEVHEVGTFDRVPRDLRESPLTLDLDLAAVFNGPHVLEIEVRDDTRQLARLALRVWVQKGLDERVRALEDAARTLPAAVRASVRYPMDAMSKISRGLMDMGSFDLARELLAAEAVASAAARTPDPFANRRGDIERHYVLAAANEILPYRIYVPRTYDGTARMPLVIALHGPNATEDTIFDGFDGLIPQLAEKHRVLVAAPLGFRPDAGFGAAIPGRPDAFAARARALSEADVMAVIQRMQTDYAVDPRRVFLLAPRASEPGARHLAAEHPGVFAGHAIFEREAQLDAAFERFSRR